MGSGLSLGASVWTVLDIGFGGHEASGSVVQKLW